MERKLSSFKSPRKGSMSPFRRTTARTKKAGGVEDGSASTGEGSGASEFPDTDRGSMAHMANFILNESMRQADMQGDESFESFKDLKEDALSEVKITKLASVEVFEESKKKKNKGQFGPNILFSKHKNFK